MRSGALKNGLLAGWVVFFVALGGCATPIDDGTDVVVVMPSRSTTSEEIAGAVQALIQTYPVCVPLRSRRLVGRPAVNLNPHSREMSRYEDAEAELDVLVRLGYLTKTALPEQGQRVFKFDRTDRGQDLNIVGSDRFCLPAERLLVAVTKVEREEGRLVVAFTQALDPESLWAQQPELVTLFAGDRAVLLAGASEGRAVLSRVWVRGEHPLQGAPHSGALWAVSYDAVHNRWEGGRWGAVTMRLW